MMLSINALSTKKRSRSNTTGRANTLMHSISLITGVFLTGIAVNGYASDYVPTGNAQYYNLNGGADYAMPAVQSNHDLTLGAGAELQGLAGCGSFNPAVSISNTINNFQSSVMGLGSSIIGSATSAVTSMPMYELQKTDPKLYNRKCIYIMS